MRLLYISRVPQSSIEDLAEVLIVYANDFKGIRDLFLDTLFFRN